MKKIMILLLFCQIGFSQDWKNDLKQWKQSRVENLTRPHGWLSLIGMEWLYKGENTIGAGKDNKIILPYGNNHVGNFNLNDGNITFTPISGVKITANNELVTKTIPVKMDSSGEPTIFKIDSFLFYIIDRGKPALRIKDSKADTLKNFSGLDYFPTSDKFRVKAEFIKYSPEKDVEIANVLGLLSVNKSPGKLKFEIDGEFHYLDVLDAGDEYEIIFADRTNGRTTYGPGRFLYIPKQIGSKYTVIDFNRSFNPPCAFTDYSTCPLPPAQNRVPAFIEAGELKYKGKNHDF